MDTLSDYGNMDIMLEKEDRSLLTERGKELDNVINDTGRHQDSESFPKRENSSQETENRNIDIRICPARHDGLAVSIEIISRETNTRLSQEMDLLMNIIKHN